MHWHSLQEFLFMGGYGTYVWGSLLVTTGAIASESWLVRCRMFRARQSVTVVAARQ